MPVLNGHHSKHATMSAGLTGGIDSGGKLWYIMNMLRTQITLTKISYDSNASPGVFSA